MAAFRSASKRRLVSSCWAQLRAAVSSSRRWMRTGPARRTDVLADTIQRRAIPPVRQRPTIIIGPAMGWHTVGNITAMAAISITGPTEMDRLRIIELIWVSRGDLTLILPPGIWVIALNRNRRPN